jgi:glycosyltransferase involved in cell wall biosynthesis
MPNKPLISVCCITYNHEKFISHTIEGVLMQKTSFDFEFIIANDCSDDSTDKVIKQNIIKHERGNIITYYSHDKNLGMIPNFAFALKACNGKYIGLCEGDDYWTDPLKLQKQVDFLESNDTYILVGYNARINNEDQEENKNVKDLYSEYQDFTTSDLLQKNPFVTAMTMFKNIGFENILNVLNNFVVADWPLFTLLSHKGKCRFYAESTGFYRIHSNSVTSKNRIEYKPFKKEIVNRIEHAVYWNNYNHNKYNYEVDFVKNKRSRALVNIALKNIDVKTAIHYSQYIKIDSLNKRSSRIMARLLQFMHRLIN